MLGGLYIDLKKSVLRSEEFRQHHFLTWHVWLLLRCYYAILYYYVLRYLHYLADTLYFYTESSNRE